MDHHTTILRLKIDSIERKLDHIVCLLERHNREVLRELNEIADKLGDQGGEEEARRLRALASRLTTIAPEPPLKG